MKICLENHYTFSKPENQKKFAMKSNIRDTENKSAAAAAAMSLQSCPTLSDPMDCGLSGSSIHGIFQARVLEWGAIAFSENKSTESQIKKEKTNMFFA